MITHLLYQILDKFKIGSDTFRKILAGVVAVMIFGLLYAGVRFMKVDIPNFTRNLAILVGIDLGGFAFLMWRKGSEKKEEKVKEEVEKVPPNHPLFAQQQENAAGEYEEEIYEYVNEGNQFVNENEVNEGNQFVNENEQNQDAQEVDGQENES